MIELNGNLWFFENDYKCVTTNGIVGSKGLIMGVGIALQAKQRFPSLPNKVGEWVKKYGNRPFICREELIITFPTKHHWKDKSDINLIRDSARKIVQIVNKYGIKKVYMPRPGCGNGGLDWQEVRDCIQEIFDDRFIVLGN